MLKDKTTVIGIGLAGETVGLDFQIRNYTSYLMNGSTQDNAGMFNIIEWTVYISKDGTVTLTADLHDSIAGEYIEVVGTVSDGMSIEQFQEELG